MHVSCNNIIARFTDWFEAQTYTKDEYDGKIAELHTAALVVQQSQANDGDEPQTSDQTGPHIEEVD